MGDEMRRRIETCWRGAAAAIVLLLWSAPALAAPAVPGAPTPQSDSVTTDEDVAVVIDVLSNDTDPQGDALFLSGLSRPASGVALIDDGGTPADPADDVVRYSPDHDFNGADSFRYRVCDASRSCATATVEVTVLPVNDRPTARIDSAAVDEDGSIRIDVLANDSDADGDAVTLIRLRDAEHGTAAVDFGGTPTDPSDDVLVYTPSPDYNGPDGFRYRICDPAGLCDAAEVTVTVAPVPDPPVPVDDAAATDEDVPVAVAVLGNDGDPDGPLTDPVVSIASSPAIGAAAYDPGSGDVTYTPNPDRNGIDSFSYEVCDGDGLCATALVTVYVAPVPDAPIAGADVASTVEDRAVTIDVTANDTDADADELTVVTASTPGHGVAVIASSSTLTYTPAADYFGADFVDYTVCDATGSCATAAVTIAVGAVNDPPAASDDAAATSEDTAVTIALLANDVDGDALSAALRTEPGHGSAKVHGDGTVTYTPAPDWHGRDGLTYSVCDPLGACADATVTIDVAAVNDMPVAVADGAANLPGAPVDIDVLANDGDVDGDPLTIMAVSTPTSGRADITAAGITYTPAEGFAGTASFAYLVCDPAGACAQEDVTMQVTAFGAITGVVWDDADGDGSVDESETDLHGVRLVLLGAGADGTVGTDDDVMIAEAFTGSPYWFRDLAAGTYQVVLDVTTLPAGMVPGPGAPTALVVTVGWGETVAAGDFAVAVAAQTSGGSLPATGQVLVELSVFGAALLVAAALILGLRRLASRR